MRNQIPGVPDGWEIEHVSRFGEPGEHCVNPEGEPHLIVVRTVYRVCIIRKIEKPARYRQFANAGEYLPHWGKPVKYQDSLGFDSIISTSELGVYTAQGRMVQFFTMEQAFGFLTFADGSPFGVRIDE
jgi:hypothetical protein